MRACATGGGCRWRVRENSIGTPAVRSLTLWRKAEEARQRVTEAIDRLMAERTPITFNGVAEAAGVTRAYLYSQPELRDRIDSVRERQVQLRSLARRERGRIESALRLYGVSEFE